MASVCISVRKQLPEKRLYEGVLKIETYDNKKKSDLEVWEIMLGHL